MRDAEIVIGSDFVHELLTPRAPFDHGQRPKVVLVRVPLDFRS
jgi:hypothetical protein